MRQIPSRPTGRVVPIRADLARSPRREVRARVRRVRRGSSGRLLASAGHILGVGLVCFVLWLLLDAQQLLSNAENGSPLGRRRSVAIAVLRPIAFVEGHLGLDSVVRAADRVVGRSISPGAGIAAPPSSGAGRSGRENRRRSTVKPIASTTAPSTTAPSTTAPTTTAPRPAAFHQPTAARPVTILDIGDSIGEDLGIGIADLLGQDAAVHLVDTAQTNTGLANPGYFNWPVNLETQLARYHPQIVIIMLGGNDWQPFLTGPNSAAVPGTASWRTAYGARVAELIEEARSAGARVFWAGLPPMSPASGLSAAMAPDLNAVFAAEAQAHGATYVPTWSAFVNAAGQYAEYLPNASGQLVEVRDPDGIHLAPPAGCDLAAGLVERAIEQTLHITF